jgi:NhaP-type Na+/H+ or K+/H+ antiporter
MMDTVLAFAITLLFVGLVSGLAEHTMLSPEVIFLLVGGIVGDGGFKWIDVRPDYPLVSTLADLALFSVLFTDGMRCGAHDLASVWRLPGRALLLGLPLTLGGIALLAHFVAGLPWLEALLLGAVLSPTDPVFAAAIVSRKEAPVRLRKLLNVESGLNDGLALPFVLLLLALVQSHEPDIATWLGEVALGVAVGVVIPWIALRIEHSRFVHVAASYKPLNALGIGLLIFSLARLIHANQFLAAFSAGITVGTVGRDVRDAFHKFGEVVTEVLKFAALLVFAALISFHFLGQISLRGYVFAFLAIVTVRPLAMWLALLGTGIDRREWAAAAWFGPRGFASVIYGIMILQSGAAQGAQLFHLAAIVIVGSIIASSSTDVIVARWVGQPVRQSARRPESHSR